jgi:hypothetical protein
VIKKEMVKTARVSFFSRGPKLSIGSLSSRRECTRFFCEFVIKM